MKKFIAIAALVAAAGVANADIHNEVGDADAALAPQFTGAISGNVLTQINGMGETDVGFTVYDVDSYVVHINGNWSASTVGGAGWDTMLFLSDMGGTLLAFNDDAVGLQSIISGSLAAGDYVLSITRYNFSFGATPTVDPNTIDNGGTPYTIFLEGMTTVAPTPGSLALLGLGGLAAARRRR